MKIKKNMGFKKIATLTLIFCTVGYFFTVLLFASEEPTSEMIFQKAQDVSLL